jgi:hypothetical protein
LGSLNPERWDRRPKFDRKAPEVQTTRWNP